MGGGLMSADTVLPVRLAPGTEDSGLAWMLAQLVRQNVAQNPRKRADFDRLNTTFRIEARDAGVVTTLAFSRGALTVHDGTGGEPKVRISADSKSVLELATFRIFLGIPNVFGRAGRKLVRKLLTGSTRISGIPGNLGQLIRLTRLLSVNG
jgi:hypothetical protein